MTRHELHKILEVSFLSRYGHGLPTFAWEHCAKSFQRIPNNLAIEHFFKISKQKSIIADDKIILKCESKSGPYYFGIGLEDCDKLNSKELSELFQNGRWYVYTWTD